MLVLLHKSSRSKIPEHFSFFYQIKNLLVRTANTEDPDQTALEKADLGLHCLSRPFWQGNYWS